jgi:hypothetical protein
VCLRKSRSKEKNSNWRGGVTKRRKADLTTVEYRQWRKAVFERDKYICVECSKKSGTKEAHHILPWAYFKDFRYDVSNGLTLCSPCHRKKTKDVFRWRPIAITLQKKKLLNGGGGVENKGYVAVDFDGTLAVGRTKKWNGPLGKPVELMLDRVKKWLFVGIEVRLFTARVNPFDRHGNLQTREELNELCKRLDKWCLKYVGVKLPITCMKTHNVLEIWDDRAIQVIKNTGELVNDEYIPGEYDKCPYIP